MTEFAPLEDVRVLDLSRGGGAAVCARLLRQLGATVVAADPAAADARPLFEASDLVLSDLRPFARAAAYFSQAGRAPARGHAVVSVTPYGWVGPYADRDADAEPDLDLDGPIVRHLVGAHAAVAALGALRWARRHRCGALVQIAAIEVLAGCLGARVPDAACPRCGGAVPTRDRADAQAAVVPCADGYLGVTASTPADRAMLAALTGLDASGPAEMGARLTEWLRTRRRHDAFHEAQRWRLPIVPVLDPAEVLGDAQSVARAAWTVGARGEVTARSPFRGTPGRRTRPRPAGRGITPLSDVSILDLGMVWAGPYCGRLLAGLGATVVKIEAPDRPDGTRFSGTGQCSGTFGDLNRGKASLVVDLTAPAGRDVFLRLACGADVVLENYSPRVMPNFGLSGEALRDLNPSLVMLSLPAFGSTGPWASYVAYGSGLELATGLACRPPLAPPAPASVPYLDYLAGAYGAVGVLAALIGRDGGGGGAHVEIAQREVACQVLETVLRGGAWRSFPCADAAVLTAHPQLAALGFFATAPADSAICYHYARPPWQFPGGQIPGERPAPIFGADSVSVLAGLARIDSIEIERLVRDNVIRTSRHATGGPPDG